MMNDFCKIVRTSAGWQMLLRIEPNDQSDEGYVLNCTTRTPAGVECTVGITFDEESGAQAAMERFGTAQADTIVGNSFIAALADIGDEGESDGVPRP